jgi:RNA-directed DNA polymerase
MSGSVGEPPPRGGGLASAGEDHSRRFGDLFNLVYDPAFLMHAWERVSTNKGARTAGIDKATAAMIETRVGVKAFLARSGTH